MLTKIYIEALLVDEDLAEQVWEAWDRGEIGNEFAYLAWWSIVAVSDRGICEMRANLMSALFIILPSLVGCATGKQTDVAMQSWMGSSIEEVISSWGPPNSSLQLPRGKTIYTWAHRRSYTTPTTTTTTTRTISVYQSGKTTQTKSAPRTTTTGGQSREYFCDMSFTANDSGLILDYYWKGNSCK